jgi:hypothetical protein
VGARAIRGAGGALPLLVAIHAHDGDGVGDAHLREGGFGVGRAALERGLGGPDEEEIEAGDALLAGIAPLRGEHRVLAAAAVDGVRRETCLFGGIGAVAGEGEGIEEDFLGLVAPAVAAGADQLGAVGAGGAEQGADRAAGREPGARRRWGLRVVASNGCRRLETRFVLARGLAARLMLL